MVPERRLDLRQATRSAKAARDRLPLVTAALVVEVVLLIALYPGLYSNGRPTGGVGLFILLIAVSVLTVAAWVYWFYAVYRGVCALGHGRYLPMWGALAWLIPYARLFVPKQLVNDLWRPRERPPGVVRAWWVAYLVASVPPSWFKYSPLPPRLTLDIWWAAFAAVSMLSVWTARAVTDRLELLVREAALEPAAW